MICSRTQAVFVVVILLFFCVSARAEDFKDIVYREVQGIALLMDAHLPDGAGPFPAAVLVHGGGWIAGDKQQYITYLFQPLAEAEKGRLCIAVYRPQSILRRAQERQPERALPHREGARPLGVQFLEPLCRRCL